MLRTPTSRTFRKGTNVAPPSGRGHGPMRECPGRIGPGAQGPIGPSRSWISLNSFKLEIGFLDKGEFKSFKLEIGFLDKGEFKLFKLEIGLEEGQGLAAPPLYIEGWCAPSPHTPSSKP